MRDILSPFQGLDNRGPATQGGAALALGYFLVALSARTMPICGKP